MAKPLRIEYRWALSHVTSRGNERKDIFRSIKDSYTTYFNVRHKRAGHLP